MIKIILPCLALIIFGFFLVYSGIIRYYKIKYSTIENYELLPEYTKKPKIVNNKVIITISTSIDRLDQVDKVIRSIFEQTVRIDSIYLMIPPNSSGETNITNELKTNYTKLGVHFFPTGKDYGEATDIVAILLQEKQCDTIIIALKDDCIYGDDYIQTLLEESINSPKCVLQDSEKTGLLLKPECYGNDCPIMNNKNKDIYTDEWFYDKANNSKIINYSKNRRF